MPAWIDPLLALQDRGGATLLPILAASTLMWTLILERYWYLRILYPRWLGRNASLWRTRMQGVARQRERMRAGFAAAVSRRLRPRLALIRALVAVLPLLGLLGTVAGLVSAFNVIAGGGIGDLRVFSSGISQALVSTVAGLVTALSGLYFSADLERRTGIEIERAAGFSLESAAGAGAP